MKNMAMYDHINSTENTQCNFIFIIHMSAAIKIKLHEAHQEMFLRAETLVLATSMQASNGPAQRRKMHCRQPGATISRMKQSSYKNAKR